MRWRGVAGGGLCPRERGCRGRGAGGDAVYDAAPPGVLPSLYISLGPEVVRDRSDKTGAGAEHEFTVSVLSDAAGFAAAKAVAAAVSDALVDAQMTLTRGRLVGLWFLRAKAARVGSGERRRIDLTFGRGSRTSDFNLSRRVLRWRPRTARIFSSRST